MPAIKIFTQPILTEPTLRAATRLLADFDAEMDFVFKKYGYPPLWSRNPGFATMVHIILEQQVSLASAEAAFLKLKKTLGEVAPQPFLELSDESLKTIGFSRQKTRYARLLAENVLSGQFSFEKLDLLDDESAKIELKKLTGIGDWTADVYLCMCLLRPDVLPKGDVALLEAFRFLKNLDARPQHDVFEKMTAHWRPWRSVGIRLLWHFYLSERGR